MKMHFKSAAVALALASVALPNAAFAQAAGPSLTVDIQRLFGESAAGKSGQTQIQAKYDANIKSASAAYQSSVTALNSQIEAARKVQKPDGTLPPANQKLVGDAQNVYNAAGQRLQNMQDELRAVVSYVQNQILRGAEPVIEQVRSERHAAIVIPKGSTLASDPAADVTTPVLQRLDQSLKTVSINLPQQGGAAPQAGQPQGR